jgi:hypothetical protein
VRAQLAEELLRSSRVAPEELQHLLAVLDAARHAQQIPPPPKSTGISDRGLALDAAGALSSLLPGIAPETRGVLFTRALNRSNGVAPRWYESIVTGDMVSRLPDEIRRELVLEVDVRGLAAWASLQPPEWQEAFVQTLSPSMQGAVRASMVFSSRDEQMRQAKRGQQELVTALQRRFVQGRLHFHELVT